MGICGTTVEEETDVKDNPQYYYNYGKEIMYNNGFEAIKAFEKAYAIGQSPYNLLSLYQMGVIYYAGNGGVPMDSNKAFYFFRTAYNKGLKEAGYMMGLCYEFGRGVLKDISKAKQYYRESGYNLSNPPKI